MRSSCPPRPERVVAVVEVGTGVVRGVTGDATLLARVSEGAAVQSASGEPVAESDLPLALARAGRACDARELVVGPASDGARVVVSVECPRAPGDGAAALAVVTVELEGDADRVRDDFLSIATHELKSPIASLRLDLERLRRRFAHEASVPGELVAREMERGVRQVTRLSVLIQNLLDASRMQTMRVELEPEPADVCAVVRDVLEALRPLVTGAGCELAVSACASIHGLWDRMRIAQVLHNLVGNAVKYGGPGKTVDVRVERAGDHARLSVSDRGPGIAAEDAARIFEPFARGGGRDDAVATHSLGLGLAIVREIVAAHGGDVSVLARDGGGTTFVVTLPVRPLSDEETSTDVHAQEEERLQGS